jgi:TonB family protein
MRCNECGLDNAVDARFCRECGVPLEQEVSPEPSSVPIVTEKVLCANGHENAESAVFCRICGAALGQEGPTAVNPPEPDAPALEQEVSQEPLSVPIVAEKVLCANGHENAESAAFCRICGAALGQEEPTAVNPPEPDVPELEQEIAPEIPEPSDSGGTTLYVKVQENAGSVPQLDIPPTVEPMPATTDATNATPVVSPTADTQTPSLQSPKLEVPVATQSPAVTEPPQKSESADKKRKHRWILAAGIFLLIVIGAGGYWMWNRSNSESTPKSAGAEQPTDVPEKQHPDEKLPDVITETNKDDQNGTESPEEPVAQSPSMTPPTVATPPLTASLPKSKAKPVPISGDVLEFNAIRKIQPIYPPMAREAQAQGDVVLDVVVDEEGNVSKITVKSGDPLLRKAAEDAVRQWKYSPTVINGEPVSVISTVTVKFNPNRVAPPPSEDRNRRVPDNQRAAVPQSPQSGRPTESSPPSPNSADVKKVNPSSSPTGQTGQGNPPATPQTAATDLRRGEQLPAPPAKPAPEIRSVGNLSVTVNVDNADIKIEGREGWRTHRDRVSGLELQPGRYEIVVSKADYRTVTKTVNVRANTNESIGFTLEKEYVVRAREYTGPKFGTLIWEGEVRGSDLVVIENGRPSSGYVSGDPLPGLPCLIQPSDTKKVAIASTPGPANQYNKIVLRIKAKGNVKVSLKWALN